MGESVKDVESVKVVKIVEGVSATGGPACGGEEGGEERRGRQNN